MTVDVRELLPLYALGAPGSRSPGGPGSSGALWTTALLDPDEVLLVERAVARDPRLAAELAAYQQAADALATAVEPVAPAQSVKRRLLASAGGGMFEAFSARMATLYEVTRDRARELLGLIERPASWVPQIIPGISFVDFEGGPSTAAADCGFVRLTPGTVFPPHTHLGEEAVIVLSGQIHDPVNNRTIVAGEDYVQLEGTTHYLVCVGDQDCIYATRAINGISVGGTRARPTKHG
jgi:quercetin dioxygenase-like cupin family protein